MPWKKCPFCDGLSYSAATVYQTWLCPYCEKDIASAKDCQPDREEVEAAKANPR
ncbi:MAG: hypothetical protein AB1576_00475 [Bacillota bacterium]|jgi:glutaredoxin